MKTQVHHHAGVTYLTWWCAPCNTHHMVPVAGKSHAWTWNQDRDRPTLSPSVKVSYNGMNADQPGELPSICHFFLRDGCVEYCADSTHALKGQTVRLEDLP